MNVRNKLQRNVPVEGELSCLVFDWKSKTLIAILGNISKVSVN